MGYIFAKARQEAPCYLVFEDLDSLVSDRVRSFFLNEVDGLHANDGILMVGSTNHLELLDPGIAKRPSRFDRKYFFPNPDLDQRVKYCEYWREKLKGNHDVKFPDTLCKRIAGITDKFSFAYIQEAFVAALLIIATEEEGKGEKKGKMEEWEVVDEFDAEETDHLSGGGDKDPLDQYLLWRVIKKQIATLRRELQAEAAESFVDV